MSPSGVDAAIHELERDVKKLQEVIEKLKTIRVSRSSRWAAGSHRSGRLSDAGRRRISMAAKKRWAAVRAAKAAKKQSPGRGRQLAQVR